MNTGMDIAQVAPIYSSSFLSNSYNPKAKAPISTAKPVVKKSPFFKVLCALVAADDPQFEQKIKTRN